MSTITKPIFLDETGQAMVSALQSLAAITSGYVGAPGTGFPSGGSSGQFLVKASSSDYDTNWSTISANDIGAISAPSNASVGDFLVYTSNGWAAQSMAVWSGGSY